MKENKESLLAKEEQRLLETYLPRSLSEDLDLTIFNYDLLTSMDIIDNNHKSVTEIAAANTLKRLKAMTYEEIVALANGEAKKEKEPAIKDQAQKETSEEIIAKSDSKDEVTLTSGRDRYQFKKILDFVTEERRFLAVSTIPENEYSKPQILFFERIKGPHPNEENAFQVTDQALLDLLHLELNKRLGKKR